MCEYKVGDRVEQFSDGKVIDVGIVQEIVVNTKNTEEIWCNWESNKNKDYLRYFCSDDPEFRVVGTPSITPEIVRTVLKAYQDYSKMEYMPEYVHKEVHYLISKKGVKESQEFKDFMVQYEKFKSYL
jgi:predicted RNA-binding protein (virulence factor B family)